MLMWLGHVAGGVLGLNGERPKLNERGRRNEGAVQDSAIIGTVACAPEFFSRYRV